jgi:hypothetical protein
MKLMVERVDTESLEILSEAASDGTKFWRIRGPFLQSEQKNKNGRIYGKSLLEREVNRYVEERVKTNRALGELDHPPTPSLSLDRVSHIIEDLRMEGNDAIGTAKILNTPMGKIAGALLEGGVKLGVSSRGVGTLKGEFVNEDYSLICVDIVGDPSAMNAYVDGIFENKEYIIDGNEIVEQAVQKLEKATAKHGSKYILDDMKRFLSDIRTGK